MERLYLHPLALAAGLTSGIVYVVCAAAVWLWPQQTVSFFATWFHGVDLMRIAAPLQLTVGSLVFGLIGTVLFTYVVGLLFAWLYNQCYVHCKKRNWI